MVKSLEKPFQEQFWKKFGPESLRDKPVVLSGGNLPRISLSAQDVFRVALKACDLMRARAGTRHELKMELRFYIDGVRILDPLAYLPLSEDLSFTGWHTRMTQKYGLKDYGIVFNDLKVMQECAEVHSLLSDLLGAIGTPSSKSEFTLFAGCYKKTPFGVHDDPNELNFYIPLTGRKRMRLWHPDYGRSNPDLIRSFEYEKHISNSVLLDAAPGDVMAWHGTWWHIGEANDDFSLAVSLRLEGFQRESVSDEMTLRRIADELYRSSAAALGTMVIHSRPEAQVAEPLPESHLRAIEAFKAIDVERLTDILAEKWLVQLTSMGFTELPVFQPLLLELKQSDLVQCPPGRPIRWADLSGNRVCIAACGRTFILPNSQLVVEILQILNSSKPVCVADMVARIEDETGSKPRWETILKLLTLLAQIGGVVRSTKESETSEICTAA